MNKNELLFYNAYEEFYEMAKQKGVNPDDILNQLK